MSEQNVAKTLPGLVVYAIYIICAMLILNMANNPIVTASCICTALLLAMLKDRHNLNMVQLCFGLIIIKLLQQLAFVFISEPAVWYNQIIYGIQSMVSICSATGSVCSQAWNLSSSGSAR